MIEIYGLELLKQEQRLRSMISDLYIRDNNTKRLLLLSIREQIPCRLSSIYQKGFGARCEKINALIDRILHDSFIDVNAINKMVDYWQRAIWWEEFNLLIPIRKEISRTEFSIDYKWGFVNQAKKIVVDYIYDNIFPFSEGLSRVEFDNKYGFINKKGELVIPLSFENASDFEFGKAKVMTDKNISAYIDKQGNTVVKPYYDSEFSDENNNLYDGLVRAYDIATRKYGFFDSNGIKVIDYKFDDVSHFSDGLAVICCVDLYGYIDIEGDIVVQPQYERVFSFSENRGMIKQNGLFGFIDNTGRQIIKINYENALNFSDGLAAVKKNGKWGFVDCEGNLVIPFKYLNAKQFSENFAFVKKISGWGFIDKSGIEYTDFNYFDYYSLGWDMEVYGYLSDAMHSFSEGMACVSKMIDIDDEWLTGHCKEAKFGFVDYEGNEVISCIYPPVENSFKNGLAKLGHWFNGGWSYIFYGYLDKDGVPYGFDLESDEKKNKNESSDFESDFELNGH